MVAEISPGSPSPSVQVPEADQGPQVGFAPSLMPNNVVPIVAPYSTPTPASGTGTPAADINPPVPSPRLITTLRPPLQSQGKLNPGQTSLQLPTGAGAGQLGILQQANLVPVVPIPVLARNGQGTDWVIPITIAGQTSVTVRAAYRDLHMSPGIRGIQISYGAGGSPVTIKCNATGFQHLLPVGPVTAFLPLYLMKNMIDLTISSAIAIPAGATAILTTEEQVPVFGFTEPSPDEGAVQLFAQTATSNSNAVATITPSANRTAFMTSLQASNLPPTTQAQQFVQVVGLQAGTESWGFSTGQITAASPAITSDQGGNFQMSFIPPRRGSGPGVALVATFFAVGAGSTGQTVTIEGYEL